MAPSKIEERVRAEMELLRQMNDHDLLMKLAEKLTYIDARLEVSTRRIAIVENRLWTAIFALAAAAVGTIVKVFWKNS